MAPLPEVARSPFACFGKLESLVRPLLERGPADQEHRGSPAGDPAQSCLACASESARNLMASLTPPLP